MSQTITFKNGTTLPIFGVHSDKTIIQNAYREYFEIRFPTEAVTYDTLTALAVPENLSEITITEVVDDKTNRVSKHCNFTVITGIGKRTDFLDGSQFYFLSVAQKSDTELAIEQLRQELEDLRNA